MAEIVEKCKMYGRKGPELSKTRTKMTIFTKKTSNLLAPKVKIIEIDVLV